MPTARTVINTVNMSHHEDMGHYEHQHSNSYLSNGMYATAYKTENAPVSANVYESTNNSQIHDSLTMIEDLID